MEANKRTDQLPATAGPQPGFLMPMWNLLLQRTERVDVANFIPVITGNFEWVTDNGTGYNDLDVVTRGGSWWQSQQNLNLNKVPGSNPAFWVQISKSSSLAFWEAGVYAEDDVFVFYTIGTVTYVFQLINVTRPFASSNFITELQASSWKQVGILAHSVAVGTSGVFTIDFLNLTEVSADGSATIVEAKTWVVNNGSKVEKFDIFFDCQVFVQTLPSTWKLSNVDNAVYDSATHHWTPLADGSYVARGRKTGSSFRVEIFGPYN